MSKQQKHTSAEITAMKTGDSPSAEQAQRLLPQVPDSHRAIEKKAYEIYQKSGCQDGNCESNWLQAEKRLNGENATGGHGYVRMIDEGSPIPLIGPANRN